MSVPKSQRSESTMEYVATAEKLAAKVFRFTNGLPKRYAFRLANPLFEHAEEVVYHAKAANLVYVTDDATFAQRRNHLIDAEGHLLHVETLLGILHEVTSQLACEGQTKPPNDNVYREFADMIERERKLISGCKRRDKSAYNSKRAGGGGHPDSVAASSASRSGGGCVQSTVRATSATSIPAARPTTTTLPIPAAFPPDSL